jgi:hypothetical protein
MATAGADEHNIVLPDGRTTHIAAAGCDVRTAICALLIGAPSRGVMLKPAIVLDSGGYKERAARARAFLPVAAACTYRRAGAGRHG